SPRQYGGHASFVHRFHAITTEQHAEFRSRVETTLALLGPDYDSFVCPHLLTSYAAEPGGASFLSGVGTGLHKIPYVPWLAMEGARIPVVDAIVRHYGREDQAGVLRPEIAVAARERMRQSIDAVARQCEPGTARVHVMQYYHLQERLGRWAGRGVQLQDLCGYDPCY